MGSRRRHLLTSDRSLPCDIVHLARKIPLARAEIEIDLADVARVRSAAVPRISWTAVFLKAYGMVAERSPCLRQSLMNFPLPHVYEHSRNVAMVAIQREHQGRPRLCWGRVIEPENRTLQDIQQQLNHYVERPVTEVFRKQLRLSRFWRWSRRMAWWVTLNVSGRTRERQVGTFSMSSLAGQGVNNRDHPTICTSSLTYGPLDRDSYCLITLVYDHRLLDGMHAAQALGLLQECLQQEIASELRQLAVRAAA